MIEIKRYKSYAGHDNCFGLSFRLKEYIPPVFFEQHEDGVGAELYFYITLFHKFGIFDCDEKHYHTHIWSTSYNCCYKGIWFDMIYDEDYDDVTFSVALRNIKNIPMIADHIKHLVETHGMNVVDSCRTKF